MIRGTSAAMRTMVVGLLVLGACSGGSRPHAADDAPPADSQPVDAPPDVAFGSASVLVRGMSRPNPVVNTPVLFTDTNGMSIETTTDAMGLAYGLVPPGGSVTAKLDDTHYATIADVMPGDHLTFGLGRFGYGGDLAVTFTEYVPNANYMLYTACQHFAIRPPTTTVTLEFCDGPISDTDVYIVGSTATMVATAAAHHVDLTTGAITVPNTWTPLRTIQVSYTGFTVPEHLSASTYDVPEGYNGGPGSLFTPTITLTLPATAPAQLITTDIEDASLPSTQHQSFIDRIDSAATTYTLTAGELRPWISDVAYTAATRTVSSAAPASLTGDIVMYELIWGDGPTTGSVPYYWDIYAPAFEPFTLPTLPADMPDPSTFPGLRLTKVVALFDNSSITSWDDARGRVYDLATTIIDPANVPDRLYVQALSK